MARLVHPFRVLQWALSALFCGKKYGQGTDSAC